MTHQTVEVILTLAQTAGRTVKDSQQVNNLNYVN
jgi:hypothetical protein